MISRFKIDDIRKRIDIDVKRKNGATEAMAKSEIDIFVQIPVQYIDKIECEAHAETVEIRSIECENMEFWCEDNKFDFGKCCRFGGG